MLPVFRKLIGEFETAVARARDSVTRTKSVVRLACLPSCATTLLPDLIRDFTRDQPGVTFVVRDVINGLVPGLVRSSEVDFGVAVRDDRHADLEWRPLFSDSLHVVYRTEGPAFDAGAITAASLASRPLILMAPGSSVREKVDEAFAAAGLTALAACEVNYMSTAVALVRAALGITILPSTAAELKTQSNICSRPISEPGFSRDIALVRRKGSTLHPSAERFVELLTQRATLSSPAPDRE